MVSIFKLEEIVADALPEERAYVRSVARAMIKRGALPKGKRGRGDPGEAIATPQHAAALLLACAACGRLDRGGAASAYSLIYAFDQAVSRPGGMIVGDGQDSFSMQGSVEPVPLELRRSLGMPDETLFGVSLRSFLEFGTSLTLGDVKVDYVSVEIGRRDTLFFARIKYRSSHWLTTDDGKPIYYINYYDRNFPDLRNPRHPETVVTIPASSIELIHRAVVPPKPASEQATE